MAQKVTEVQWMQNRCTCTAAPDARCNGATVYSKIDRCTYCIPRVKRPLTVALGKHTARALPFMRSVPPELQLGKAAGIAEGKQGGQEDGAHHDPARRLVEKYDLRSEQLKVASTRARGYWADALEKEIEKYAREGG